MEGHLNFEHFEHFVDIWLCVLKCFFNYLIFHITLNFVRYDDCGEKFNLDFITVTRLNLPMYYDPDYIPCCEEGEL